MRIPSLAAYRAALVPCLALVLAACQDPTGVGLGLIDDETSQPNVTPVVASSVQLETITSTTAGFAESGTPAQSRVLIGTVLDPVFGDAAARAYVDASFPTSGRPTNFQDSTITAVAIQLRFDEYITVDDDTTLYVYGDPTAALPIEVREINTSWAPTDLAVDAQLSTVEDVIATGTILPTDTTFTLNLDPAWVAANASTLRDADFVTAFEGFEIRVPEGTMAGVIRGFNASRSDLLIATARDTLRFPINEVLTSIDQVEMSASDDVRTLRAGGDQALSFDFDLASVGAAALARADVRLPIERSLTGGTAFIRPLSSRALLVGVDADGERTQLAEILVGAEGDAKTVGGPAFTAAVQDVLIGSRTYARYEVSLPSNPVSLSLLPVVISPAEPIEGPRFTLTLVGQPIQ